MPRFFVDLPLATGVTLTLPPGASRHAQVLRLQPGDAVTLFDGHGGQWQAEVTQMGRKLVDVLVGAHDPSERELALAVTLAVGMPANERMDDLVEKATELGVACIQPLMCERSVLRLSGERAERKREHWQAVAVAACEQSGRTRVPVIEPVRSLAAWLRDLPVGEAARVVLSTAEAPPLPMPAGRAVIALSGPEGGLAPGEEAAARAAGFVPASLGPRILRADTAPLAALAVWSLGAPTPG
ncbi:MAG: 16S rRNA (uracil(1498)-N(3))-methyltransferase [Rhizobacter sp.]